MRYAAAILTCAALAATVPAAAVAQPVSGRGGEARASFDLVRAYLSELRNTAGEAPAGGPREFRLERASGDAAGSETAPIARLAAMLRNCRKASFAASWGNPQMPKRAEGRQHWECLGEGAEDRSVQVTAVSVDGKTIDSVGALLGGPIAWPGPAPGIRPKATAAEAAEFEINQEKVFAFLGQVSASGTAASPTQAFVWAGKDRQPISIQRAQQILAPCERLGAFRESAEIDGERRSGVVVTWKCDKRSGAHADLQGLITVDRGAVDRFYLSPYLDYAIPSAAGVEE